MPRSARVALSIAILLAAACGQGRRAPAAAIAGFDGARAFRDLEALVEIGPRPAGSPGAAAARDLIRDRLRQAGWVAEAHEFRAAPPHGAPVPMTNLVARRGDAGAPRVLVLTHYDTKNIAGISFVGANDGASGVAVLLEVARALSGGEPAPPIALLFCDGEEAFGPSITDDDGLYGSKALAQRMADDGTLASVEAVILVDMVGDRDLNLALDLGSSASLRQQFEAAAAKLGLPPPFDAHQQLGVIDDHTPFQERGVREVLALIDFQYGSRASPGPRWHTAQDTLDAVSAESLAAVGRPLVQLLQQLSMQGAGHRPNL